MTEEIPFPLPKGWCWSRLDSLAKSIAYGVSYSAQRTGMNKYLRITDIQDGFVNWDMVPYVTIKANENDSILKEKDIVFARTGATVGKSFLIENCPNNTVYASYLIRVRMIDISVADYVYAFFNSPTYWKAIMDQSVGTGQPNCNGTKLANLLIPVPPMSEQKRITIKLSKALAILVRIKVAQESIVTLSNRIKKAILAEVFSSDKSYYSQKLSAVADITMGQSVPSEKMHAHSQEGDLEFHQGKTCFSSCGLLSSGVFTAEYKKVSLPNSVLLSMRAPVGAVIINDRTIAVGRGLCSIRPTPSLDLYYLFWYLTLIEKELVKQATGTTFLAIGVEVVRNIEIPTPPIDHQRHIASLIERADCFLKAIAAV